MPSERLFDAAKENWTTIHAARFFFEPYCTEFEPGKPGEVVVLVGDNVTRHRGVEVRVEEGGLAVVWVPQGGRTFWLPSLADGESVHVPWETRLREFDHAAGTRVVV